MTSLLNSRQKDALRELAHLGHAHGASMLARLVGDVGVMVDVPLVLSSSRSQLVTLLGGHDVRVVAATFALEGDLSGQLWWVLQADDAQRLGRRLLSRPGLSGPLSANTGAALAEASNIVASATVDAIGNFLRLSLLPSTPSVLDTTVGSLVSPQGAEPTQTLLASAFLSTDAQGFAGWSVLIIDDAVREVMLRRLSL